jgi:CBS domain-containing protein
MRVEEVCTRAVKSCTKETPLTEAAALMWDGDCGILPVLDEAGKVVGVVTDRDICVALPLIGRPAADVPVRILPTGTLHACRPSDGLREALKTMRTQKVRRLPVVDGAGTLQGMISLSDIARAAKPDRVAGPSDVSYEDLALALQTICGRRPVSEARVPAPQPTAFV